MIPLYRPPGFVFRFAEERLVGRFHLEAVEPGTAVEVFAIQADSDELGQMLKRAVTGPGGWVDLAESLRVTAALGFYVRVVGG